MTLYTIRRKGRRDIPVRLARNAALLLGIYDREALMRRVREFLKRE